MGVTDWRECAACCWRWSSPPPPGHKLCRLIPGHVIPAASQLASIDALAGTNQLHLVLGLPLRNPRELDALLQDLYDPSSTHYHQWLTPREFTERFGPTVDDYEKVVRFAARRGFQITHTHANRMMVNVDAPVSNIERAFQVKLLRYAHPTEDRTFYAPDSDPTVDADIPIEHIAGLDNFILPRRLRWIKDHSAEHQSDCGLRHGFGPGRLFHGQ